QHRNHGRGCLVRRRDRQGRNLRQAPNRRRRRSSLQCHERQGYDGELWEYVQLLAQGDEKLVQLLERLAHVATRASGGDGTVESFLRRIEVAHDEQRLSTLLFEGHR